MEDTDKNEILKAVVTLSEHLEANTKEVRTGFERLDRRLLDVQEEITALANTVDSLIEGDTLGRKHITLTRDEYDAFVALTKLPNRFAH